MLQHNNTLEILNLLGNNIGDSGARALATTLRQNNTITLLWLGSNNIGSLGAQALNDVAAEKRTEGARFDLLV
eukprot:NODE_11610_length_277_cov_190.986486.p2 GENE.NODE_11610_length_277_cov_190.986486~~NODE_11610_length_277_cov_190.986486.p2  ORF type:complete len:81 (-),score=24.13 NODE_11610_length_277_cov_190.986486:34-252(-)